MISYSIQVVLFQVLFLLFYDVFLSRETFFSKNRWYLLSTALLSFLIPLVKITTFRTVIELNQTIVLPEILVSPQNVIETTVWYQSTNYLEVFFLIGFSLAFFLFLMKSSYIVYLIIVHKGIKKKGYTLVYLPKKSKAFSFFNIIFLGCELLQEKQDKIIKHELVHSQQKHTLDLLLFEVLKIVMWFNPLLYLYQNRISLIHEYIADDIVTKDIHIENYINNLLSDVFQIEHISFVNHFYKQTLIKKRIHMMTKRKSNQKQQFKYVIILPVIVSMLIYSACTDTAHTSDSIQKENRTVYSKNNGMLVGKSSETLSYLDTYIGEEIDLGKELQINDLSESEKVEFLQMIRVLGNSDTEVRVFSGVKGRKIGALFLNSKTEDSAVTSFSSLDEAPAFPNEGTGKDNFNRNMMNFVQTHFDTKLANSLDLNSGKKRIYVQFKIEKDGRVTDVKVRAPHAALKEEVTNMMHKLPKFIPGKKDGETVTTAYTLPIAFVIN